jgi:hypothetical protein
MKKILLLIVLFLPWLVAYGALPNQIREFEVSVPYLPLNFEVGASALYLEPAIPQLDYALVFPMGMSVERDGGRFRNVRPNNDFGYEIYVGYILPCVANDIRLTYMAYQEKRRDHVGAPEGGLLATLAAPFISIWVPDLTANVTLATGETPIVLTNFPLIPANIISFKPEDIIEADAKNVVRQGSVDLDVGQFINIDNFLRVRLFEGLRYSRVRDQLVSTYLLRNFSRTEGAKSSPIVIGDTSFPLISFATLTSTSVLQEVISQTSKFDGIGPRFGADGSFYLGAGFGLIGRISSAFLVGRQQTSLSKRVRGNLEITASPDFSISTNPGFLPTIDSITSPNPFSVFVDTIEDVDGGKQMRVIPNIEARIGLDYTVELQCCRKFNIEIGYYVNHYFDVVNRISAAVIESGRNFNNTIDVGFAGPYLTLSAML